MINIGGYSDWVASAQHRPGRAEGDRDQGHAPEPLRATTYDNDVYNGHYQLAYDGNETGGPSAVLRDAAAALLEELGADRPAGVLELGAVLRTRRPTS